MTYTLDNNESIFLKEIGMLLPLSELSRKLFADADNIKIWEGVLGTSGHVEHAAERKHENPLPVLSPKEYISRPELDSMLYSRILLTWTTVIIHGDQVSV
jgi:hypothetical protein